MVKVKHDSPNRVYACPECDKTRIHKRDAGWSTVQEDVEYRCWECGAEFAEDDIVDREARNTTAGPSKHALPKFVQEKIQQESSND